VHLDELLSSLQEEKNRLEVLSQTADEAGQLASKTIRDFESKKEKFEDKLQRQQETIERNNKYLNHGKRMAQFIESWNLKAKNKELLDELKKYVVVEKTKVDEERKQKTILKKIGQKGQEKEKKQAHRDRIKTGSLVRMVNTKQTGTVLEIENGQAIVAFGVFKTKLDLGKLEFIQ
jgi:DNA mismatch repair protein MutS2